MKYSKEEILKYLPHRDPFLFLDSIEDIILPKDLNRESLKLNDYHSLKGSKVVASFTVREDLEILKGHFPNNPILPGVVMVEMMAQASAFVSSAFIDGSFDDYEMDVLFSSVDKVKFRKVVKPPMRIIIEAELRKSMGSFQAFKATCSYEGQIVAEGSFMASLILKKKEK